VARRAGQPLLEVGRVVRAHGIRGEVAVKLVTDRTERLAPGAVLVTVAGERQVTAARPHQDGYLVAFAGVSDRSGAEGLRGPLLAAPLNDPDTLWVHELIGSDVVDLDGALHGRVAAVEANPASDLLVLDDGRLVPLRFVVGTSAGTVTVDPPAGLLDGA
jgi:16S rRNA processing protein RimM